MSEKQLNFEESVKRLEEIVHLLEAEKTPLEEALKLYEEGVKLVSVCSTTLQNAEQKIKLVAGDGTLNDTSAAEVAE